MKVFRHGHLVYLPLAKNASTFYTNVFRNHLHWLEEDSSSIDMKKDKVFAHIQNPETRHINGTVEALRQLNLLGLVEHPAISQLLPVAVFDLHSYPLVTSLGEDWCYQIDWIPLDHPADRNSTELTELLLKHHSVTVDLQSMPRLYEASPTVLRTRQKLRNLMETVKFCQTLAAWHDRDTVLYWRVVSNYKPSADTWPEISWLSHYNKE